MKLIIPIIVTGVGVVLLALTVIMGWVVVPNIIDDKIVEQVRLVNNTETFDKWKELPVPIYLKFYILNVTNADDVENLGAKPKLQELGPYSYKEHRIKINLQQSSDNLIKYEQVTTYFWDPETSCDECKEDDQVNIVNIAFISVVDGIAQISPELAAFLANSVLGTETLIKRNVKVGELLFYGFDVRLYTHTLGPLLPVEFSEGRFGLYKGNNASTDGEWEIYTGTENTADFGRVKTWKEPVENATASNYVPKDWWVDGSYCAMVNGSDGSIFPPFVEKSWVMYVFNTDLCRSLYLVYEKEVKIKDITAYRFVAPKKMLEDPRTNRDNRCFCKEASEGRLEDCTHGGAIHVRGCRGGAPIIMSTPHFLDGWEGYLADVDMGPPDKEKHETTIDIEPNTGLNLAASKKIQVNIEIKKIEGIIAMQNMKQKLLVFPLVWADETADLDDENADDVKAQLLTPLKIVKISKWSLLGVSCLIGGIGAGLFIFRHMRGVETV